MKEIREIMAFWEVHRGQPLVLATLVGARGSSYRRPGARMLISAAGEAVGGVSAGCIEEEVITCASEVLRTGKCQMMTFDTHLRFGCNGAIDIFVEPLREEVMTELRDHLIQRQSCRLETVFDGGTAGTRIVGFENVPGAFVQKIDPILRLILIGGGYDTTALSGHAALLGWEVLQRVAAPVLAEMLDDRTAVLIATHNFGRDCAALRQLLPAGLKYLGLIGSRRRREDLLFEVMNDDMAARSSLFAPAGLHLGGESPEEIALSIVAEIQCVFGGGTSGHLCHRKAAIHKPAAEDTACAAELAL